MSHGSKKEEAAGPPPVHKLKVSIALTRLGNSLPLASSLNVTSPLKKTIFLPLISPQTMTRSLPVTPTPKVTRSLPVNCGNVRLALKQGASTQKNLERNMILKKVTLILFVISRKYWDSVTLLKTSKTTYICIKHDPERSYLANFILVTWSSKKSRIQEKEKVVAQSCWETIKLWSAYTAEYFYK